MCTGTCVRSQGLVHGANTDSRTLSRTFCDILCGTHAHRTERRSRKLVQPRDVRRLWPFMTHSGYPLAGQSNPYENGGCPDDGFSTRSPRYPGTWVRETA